MRKIKNLLRFTIISVFTLTVLAYVGQFLFRIFWNFELLDKDSYATLKEYWEKGGVFNTFRDCSLGISLLLLPIIWIKWSYKIYKKGFFKTILFFIDKTYRKITRPKNMEAEHVALKNIGGKDKTLDEILADKIKEQNKNTNSGHMSANLRKQISAKIEENKKD